MESGETSTRHERASMVRRRHFLTLIGGVAGSGLLAACGAGTPAPPSPTPSSAPIPPLPITSPTSTAVSAPAANASASSPSGATSASGQATGQVFVIEAVEYGFKTMTSIPGGQTVTGREREVFGLIAQGHRNAAIAGRLHLSEKAVRNHVTNILSKLQVTDRTQAIIRARDAGLGTD